MRRFVSRSILSLLLLATILLPLVYSRPAAALIGSSSQSQACQGINLDQSGNSTSSNACTSDGTGGLNDLLKTVLNILSLIVGIAAVIMIIVGGFRYVTSGGDSSGTASAKNTIIYAIVGLVIAVLAQVLVQFVLDKTNCASNPTATQCQPAKKK
jgi:type IV secretion system pilin